MVRIPLSQITLVFVCYIHEHNIFIESTVLDLNLWEPHLIFVMYEILKTKVKEARKEVGRKNNTGRLSYLTGV